jgi:anti-sigma28 factor (negative regulator of flagellin synthesis)
MVQFMTLSEDIRIRKGPARAPLGTNAEVVARQMRVEELRQMVASGAYKVSPQRLALKILVKALREPKLRLP